MPRTAMFALVLLLAASATTTAQVVATVGPDFSPVGSPIQVALSNHGTNTEFTGACFYTVQDASGNFVFNPFFCILIIIPINPGQVHATTWDQRDDFGNPVPPGTYTVNVSDPFGGVTNHLVVIGGVDAATEVVGTPRIGTTRDVYLTAPMDGGRIYLMGASVGTSVGIPTCNGLFPLDNDFLLQFSTTPGNGVYVNTIGLLDLAGSSTSPKIAFPNNPTFVGLSFNLAFLAINPVGACPVTRISVVETVTIQ